MEVTFINGTSQQQQWVNDAIAGVAYPLDAIGLGITVDFTDTLPVSPDLGHEHTYMVTVGGGGTFTIYVAKWADDPLNRNNSGLPNPAADIYDFFKQSFVHELGHCVHLTMIVNDAQRVAAAGDFTTEETTGGSGVRVGALSDWSAATWDHNMMEAIAEVFKCTYYTGRLIFGNRTIWDIDASGFGSLMTLLIPPSVLPATGRASIKVVSTDFGNPPVGSGTVDQVLRVQMIAGAGMMELMLSTQRVVPYGADEDNPGPTQFAVAGYASGVMGVSGAANEGLGTAFGTSNLDPGGSGYVGAVFKTAPTGGAGSAGEDPATHLVPLDGVATPVCPFWVSLDLTETEISASLWQTDPQLGGSPLISTESVALAESGPAAVLWFSSMLAVGADGNAKGAAGTEDAFIAFGTAVYDDLRWANIFFEGFSTDDLPGPNPVFFASSDKYSIIEGNFAVADGVMTSSPTTMLLGENFPPALPLPPDPFIDPFIAAGPPEGGSVRLG